MQKIVSHRMVQGCSVSHTIHGPSPSLHPERKHMQIRKMSAKSQRQTNTAATSMASASVRADPSALRLTISTPNLQPGVSMLPISSTPKTFISTPISRQGSSVSSRRASRSGQILRRAASGIKAVGSFFAPPSPTSPSNNYLRSNSLSHRSGSRKGSTSSSGSGFGAKMRDFFNPDLSEMYSAPLSYTQSNAGKSGRLGSSKKSFEQGSFMRPEEVGHRRYDSARPEDTTYSSIDAFAGQRRDQLRLFEEQQQAARNREYTATTQILESGELVKPTGQRHETLFRRRNKSIDIVPRLGIDKSKEVTPLSSNKYFEPPKMTALLASSKLAASKMAANFEKTFRPPSVASEMSFADCGVTEMMEQCQVCGALPYGAEVLHQGKCVDCKGWSKSNTTVSTNADPIMAHRAHRPHVSYMRPPGRRPQPIHTTVYEDPGNPFVDDDDGGYEKIEARWKSKRL